MPGFFRGLGYPFRGFAFLAGHRALWKYAAGAYAVNFLFFTAAFVALYAFWPDLLEAVTPRKTPPWLAWFMGCLIMILAAFLALLLFTIVGNLVAGPFLDAMTERMMGLLGETLPPSRGPGSALVRSVVNQFVKLVLFGGIQVLLFVLWITPLGFLHPPLAGFLTVLFLALEFADYPLDARRVPVPARLAWVFRHARPALGFGAACFALSFVPFLLYFLLPFAVAGAVLLVRDIDAAGSKS
jgi:CysZ protein